MKVLAIFFSFITVSHCRIWRNRQLKTIHLRETNKRTFTKVISAEIGQTQDFICPDEQEFSLYLVSNEAFQQCHTIGQRNILNCNRPWKENKVCLMNKRAFQFLSAQNYQKETQQLKYLDILHVYLQYIKVFVKMTIPYEEMTATGELEFKRGEKYWIISTNCKIKIEIQIKYQSSSQPATTTSTMTSTTTSTSMTPERTTKSPSHTAGDEVWIEKISKQEDTNDVDTRARIQTESEDGKTKIFSLEFSLGGFSGIGLTLLMISICYFARRIFLCVRNRRRLKRERMRGDSLATDLSYQTPREIFA